MQLRVLPKVARGVIGRLGAPYQPSRTCDKSKQEERRITHCKNLISSLTSRSKRTKGRVLPRLNTKTLLFLNGPRLPWDRFLELQLISFWTARCVLLHAARLSPHLMAWKCAVFFCTLLACPAQLISKGVSVPPELVRSTVFRRLDGGPSGEAKFLTVVVSAPQAPGAVSTRQGRQSNRPGRAGAAGRTASSVLAPIVVHFGKRRGALPSRGGPIAGPRRHAPHRAKGTAPNLLHLLADPTPCPPAPSRDTRHAFPLPGGYRGLVDPLGARVRT